MYFIDAIDQILYPYVYQQSFNNIWPNIECTLYCTQLELNTFQNQIKKSHYKYSRISFFHTKQFGRIEVL